MKTFLLNSNFKLGIAKKVIQNWLGPQVMSKEQRIFATHWKDLGADEMSTAIDYSKFIVLIADASQIGVGNCACIIVDSSESRITQHRLPEYVSSSVQDEKFAIGKHMSMEPMTIRRIMENLS